MKTYSTLNEAKSNCTPIAKRVLLRPFHVMSGPQRPASEICAQILALPEDQVETLLRKLCGRIFGDRHKDIRGILPGGGSKRLAALFAERPGSFQKKGPLADRLRISPHEYSYQAAALFILSIVPHPDQSNLPGRLPALCAEPSRVRGKAIFPPSPFSQTGLCDLNGCVAMDAPPATSVGAARVTGALMEKEPVRTASLVELNLARRLQLPGSAEILHGESFTAEARARVSGTSRIELRGPYVRR